MDNQNELIQRPNWWKRNWKWALPVGGCLTIIIVGAIILVGGVYSFASKIKTETGSEKALIEARANANVIAILGEPIESNGFGNFNISIKNGVKTSNSTVPIKGPNGEATIHISTREEDDERVYDVYNVTFEDSDTVVDLKSRKALESD